MHDADRRHLAGRDADHAVAESDLAADARHIVAAARHREELAGARVGHQDHRVPDAEAIVERRECVVQQVGQIRAAGDPLRDRTHGREVVPLRRRPRQREAFDLLDREDPVDIGPLQPEHARHAGVRRDAREVRLHPFVQRTAGLEPLVLERDPIPGERHGIDDQHDRAPGGQHVLARLVEELVRQRHVLRVHVVHLRHERDVGHALGRTGGHRRGNRAVQRGTDGVDGDRHRGRGSGVPALGPGVCSNAAVGVKSIAWRSPSTCANITRAYSGPCPTCAISRPNAST